MPEMTSSRLMALWLFPKHFKPKQITREEKEWSNQLPDKRSIGYKHSRGCLREALSNFWKVDALEIPLIASPGKPPKLANGWGYVSISHCDDALLIGWSKYRLGLDIERADRQFAARSLSQRYFTELEQIELKQLNKKKLYTYTLQKWVKKEAAIKWQRGKLAKDLRQWEVSIDSKLAVHRRLGYKVNVFSLNYQAWIIGIASYNHINNISKLICLY